MADLEIGVVVPTLNSATTLDWTLLALRSQKGCLVQVVVVDSGSMDGTLDICRRWGVGTEYVPPGNMYRAINAGMRVLNTEWLTYLNSDDLVYQDAYARLIELGIASQADVVYGHSDYIDAAGRFLYSDGAVPCTLLPGLIENGIVGFAQPAAVFRRAMFTELGGFNEEYRLIADFDFFARAFKASKKLSCLPAPAVSAFRVHPNQYSYRESQGSREEVRRFLAGWKREKPFVGFAALFIWRLCNVRHYGIRYLRTRSIHKR